MSIKINYRGRIGNNIMQYIAALYLAKQNNLFLATDPTSVHHNSGNWQIDTIKDKVHEQEFGKLLGIEKHKQGLKLEGDILRINDDNFEVYLRHIITQPVEMDGFFQMSALWVDHHSEIKGLFNVPSDFQKSNKNTLCVVYRSYKEYKLRSKRPSDLLEYDYYDQMCSDLSYDAGFIMSDDLTDCGVKNISKKYNLKAITMNPLDSMLFAINCDKLVVGQGTYCYLCAYLSRASKILHPVLVNANPQVNNPNYNKDVYDFIIN